MLYVSLLLFSILSLFPIDGIVRQSLFYERTRFPHKKRDLADKENSRTWCASHDGCRETKPMEKFTTWKFSLCRRNGQRVVAQKVSAIPTSARVESPFVYFGMKSRKIAAENAVNSGSFFPLPFSSFRDFNFPTRHGQRVATPPHTGTKWLRSVYIIPTTLSSNEETVKSAAARRSRVTSKELWLADSGTNSKIYFHLLPTRNSFSPRFSLCFACASHKTSSVCLSCVRCGNSGIVEFFSWTCAHHRYTRRIEK